MTAPSEAAPDPAGRNEDESPSSNRTAPAVPSPGAHASAGGGASGVGGEPEVGDADAMGAAGAAAPTGVESGGRMLAGRPAGGTGAPRPVVAAWVTALGLFVLVGVAGESAAEPPLGASTVHPPWDLGLGLPPAVVDAALLAAYLLAAAAVWRALRAVEDGWRPRPRTVGVAAVLAVGALLLVPPFGSADHLSYVAYGRIAAEGGDPYAVAPDDWPPGDPVVDSAEVPWDDTTSVYGPVATAVQAAVAELGGGSLRVTVWLWQLVAGASFLVTGLLLHRRARAPAARARVAVLWTLNPLLLGVLVAGAHLDAVSALAAVACLALGVRDVSSSRFVAMQLAAGLALGVAAGSKLPYAAAGVAVLWAHRRLPRLQQAVGAAALLVGAAAVLVPAHLWAGPHVYDQARDASRFTSLATPWRPLVNAASALGWAGARDAVPVAFALVALLTLLATIGLLRPLARRDRQDGALALLALAVAYVVAAPYVLPWYDALIFAPLALVAGTLLDRPLLLRLTVLAVAYVPGRAAGEPSTVSDALLDLRQFAAPVATAGVLVWLLVTGLRALRREPGH